MHINNMCVQFSETPVYKTKSQLHVVLECVCSLFLFCMFASHNTKPTKTPTKQKKPTKSQLDDQITTSNRVIFWRSRHNKTIRAVSRTNRLHILNPSLVVAMYNHCVRLQWTTITVRIVPYQQLHRQLAITAPAMRYRQPLRQLR